MASTSIQLLGAATTGHGHDYGRYGYRGRYDDRRYGGYGYDRSYRYGRDDRAYGYGGQAYGYGGYRPAYQTSSYGYAPYGR